MESQAQGELRSKSLEQKSLEQKSLEKWLITMSIEIAARSEAAPLVVQTNTIPPKLLYSKQEAAEMLSVSVRTIDNLIMTGELTTRRIGSRVLVPHSSLLQFTKRDHSTQKRVQ